MKTFEEGRDAVHPLQYFTNSSTILILGRTFAFFALVTSFLGVGVGLVDFLADGLKIEKQKKKNRFLLLFVAFVPPLFFSLVNPSIFLQALGLAGGFGCALLLGVLPILMVWKAKYKMKAQLLEDSILGKRSVLLILLLFVCFEIACEVFNLSLHI